MAVPLAKQGGFTLVELVIVLVLVGILSVVALPRFFNADSFQERGYGNEVAAALRYAQKLAVAEGCQVRVRTSAAGVDIYRRQACDASSAFEVPVSHPGRGGNYGVAPPTGVSPGNATIIFDAMGRALNSSGVASDFSISIGNDFSLSVVGETGLIRTP